MTLTDLLSAYEVKSRQLFDLEQEMRALRAQMMGQDPAGRLCCYERRILMSDGVTLAVVIRTPTDLKITFQLLERA